MRKELALDHAYHWEADRPDKLWLTQPVGHGEIRTWTWSQAMDEARRMAAHLKSLELPEKSHIALFSKNSAWWFMADLAIWMAGHVTIPLYPTLTENIIRYTLDHSESKLIFVGKLDGYDDMKGGIPADLPRIVMPLAPEGTEGEPWADIIERTPPMEGHTWRDPEETATIIYTSGSTGEPKGVMTSFRAMAVTIEKLQELYDVKDDDRMLSYLPLAHVFERWIVESGTLVTGFEVFFAESLDTFLDDLRRARPTLFVSVPRLWQKFQIGVSEKLPPSRLNLLLKIPFVNGMIRKKVLSGLGLDHVRIAGTGSAPIPAELIEWYRRLGLNLYEGWAMSENFAYGTSNREDHNKVGTIGKPYPGVEIRISEQGEILCKSPGMMQGYYKRPEITAAAFDEEGWLKTGDKGSIDDDGYVRITGRVKEIFKTSKGKYVSPAPIETKLLLHDDVEMACVMGSGFPQPHALLMLSEAARGRLEDANHRASLQQTLAGHLETLNEELPSYERLEFVAVTSSEWTIGDGLLTPTLKIRRSQVEELYQARQADWYAAKTPVVWA